MSTQARSCHERMDAGSTSQELPLTEATDGDRDLIDAMLDSDDDEWAESLQDPGQRNFCGR